MMADMQSNIDKQELIKHEIQMFEDLQNDKEKKNSFLKSFVTPSCGKSTPTKTEIKASPFDLDQPIQMFSKENDDKS